MLSDPIRLTGLPSVTKARLAAALEAAGLQVSNSGDVRVHAETDLEAWLEPAQLAGVRNDRAAADLVVPVDWEPLAKSVGRVLAHVAAHHHPSSGRA